MQGVYFVIRFSTTSSGRPLKNVLIKRCMLLRDICFNRDKQHFDGAIIFDLTLQGLELIRGGSRDHMQGGGGGGGREY